MKKVDREVIHYIILAVTLTATIFLAHSLSGFIEQMTLSPVFIEKFLSWILLYFWYLLFIGVILVILDLILHKTLKI